MLLLATWGTRTIFSFSPVVPVAVPASAPVKILHQNPMLHPVLFVEQCLPKGIFEGKTFLHAKTHCLFPNLEFVMVAFVPQRLNKVFLVAVSHEKISIAQELVQKVGKCVDFKTLVSTFVGIFAINRAASVWIAKNESLHCVKVLDAVTFVFLLLEG